MFYIVYTVDDVIFQNGPYDTEQEAMDGARQAQKDGEFDINDQHIYLQDSNGELSELETSELE